MTATPPSTMDATTTEGATPSMTDVPRTSPYPMIPMADALSIIHDSLQPLPPTLTPISSALHQTLAATVHAPHPLPPFRASIKDGYALTLPPTDGPLLVIGESMAGAGGTAPEVRPGTAVYVTTGAPVPDGTDAVVMSEDTLRADETHISVTQWPARGADVREVGSDVEQGTVVLESGVALGAAEVGLLAACGVASVSAVRRPAIGVLSTGDELVDVQACGTGQLGHGKIVDSNRPMLVAGIREALPFCDAVDLGIARDEAGAVREALEEGLRRCDVVLTSGGVSMGTRDVLKAALAAVGTVRFGRVNMKPGKPLTFATADGGRGCIVGLPGNPASAFVCFHLAVATAAKRLAGWARERALGTTVQASLVKAVRLDRSRPEFHRAILEWVDGRGYVAHSTGSQTSSRLLSARSATGLLALPRGDGELSGGTAVTAYLLPGAQYLR